MELTRQQSQSIFLNKTAFEQAFRVANMLAASTIVPEHFQENVGNCMIALNFAHRIKADPFMVMQSLYVVHGKPGIEGKLVIALINQCGRFRPLQFEEGQDFCYAYAKDIKSDEILEGTKITLKMVKAEGWYDKKGSKWKTIPDQMYRYRAAAFFARTHCPEVLLGMQTKEELIDVGPPDTTADKAKELTEKLKEPGIVIPEGPMSDKPENSTYTTEPEPVKQEREYPEEGARKEEAKSPVFTKQTAFLSSLEKYRDILGDESVDKVLEGHRIELLDDKEKEVLLTVLKAQADLQAAKEEAT